jgi:hypothetical protein
MARTYRSSHTRLTVSLPLIPDLLAAMSGFRPIPSGFPPGPDVPASPGIRGKMTHSGHIGSHPHDLRLVCGKVPPCPGAIVALDDHDPQVDA